MKKLTLLFVFLVSVFAMSTGQETIDVTLQVDLKEAPDILIGEGVWVFMDADWYEWYEMTDVDGDSIYTYTVQKDANSSLTYRFSYQFGPDYYDYTEEPVPAECANADGFREVLLPNHNITLGPTVYGLCSGDTSDITLHVDLNNVTDMFDGGKVWVYMDANWDEYYEMTDADGDKVYDFTVPRPVGDTLYYRFSYQNGPDEWYDYHEEAVPEACSFMGFRSFVTPNTDVSLPEYAYGSCDGMAVSRVNLIFQVDMSNYPNPNDVQVVIKNPWIWTALDDQGDGIWSDTVEVDPNRTYPFTFVNGGQDNWDEEESVPVECNFGTESAPERHVVVAEEDIVLDIVSFGECSQVTSTHDFAFAKIQVFPNPADDYVIIASPEAKIKKVEVFDLNGKKVNTHDVNFTYELTLNTKQLTKGLYTIRIKGEQGVATKKLIIN